MFKILNNAEDCKDWQNSKSVKKMLLFVFTNKLVHTHSNIRHLLWSQLNCLQKSK